MTLSDIVKHRYTAKAFDPNRKINEDAVKEIRTLLQYAPSSTNAQPWHFIIASSDEGKARIAESVQGSFSFNADKILKASHVVVFCSKVELNEEHLQQVLAKEDKDGRFATPQAKQGQHNRRNWFIDVHRYDLKDLQHWVDKQVYLALGTLLLGVEMLGIDACPMEGFDALKLSQVLDLRSKGVTPTAIVSLGYHAETDFNRTLPKSRLDQNVVISEI